jgi:DNA-binding NarL/FixJ family response regulator
MVAMSASARPAAAASPLDVWVVEDNRMLREGLADLLNEQPDMRCPLAVGTCADFLAALGMDKPPDIVLMDIGLPDASGIDGVRRISSVSPASQVIILTIHAEDEKVFEAICAGASGYLLKPSDPAKILEAVREVQRGAAPVNPFIARKMLGLFARLTPPRPSESDYGLTNREKTILQHLVDGLTKEQIAVSLGLSYHTIGNHVRHIYRKLHVSSRSRAVAKALKEDLV